MLFFCLMMFRLTAGGSPSTGSGNVLRQAQAMSFDRLRQCPSVSLLDAAQKAAR
ncbi:Uncharacterized protein dnm_011490 [Desulfonema magnum]|uniref:Uncharacterized protein n=1 Tax=Desulfonema magnum TaxID=45655 RepID=A0A975BG64_9BACT|nr:Uncharacterized protein dnm_011490 [Desulfonema magnum]